MFSVLRSRLSYANVVATLALVFAMSGGALAASKFLIVSTKQIKPSVLAQLKGKAGANGAPGAQGPGGPAGPQGPAGLAGANGKDGAPGAAGAQGPEGPAGPAGHTGSPGAKGATGPEGPQGQQGATGPQGSPWTAGGTLPSGQTETGAWSVNLPSAGSGASALAPVSFSIPLPVEGEGFYIDAAETETGEGPAVTASGCTGSPAKPTAPAGKLCVYTEEEETAELEGKPKVTIGEKPGHYGTAGAFVGFFTGPEGLVFAHGVWAVTAP